MGDGLPDTICVNCIEKLENAFSFKLQCESSDSKLRQQNLLTIHSTTDVTYFEELKSSIKTDSCNSNVEYNNEDFEYLTVQENVEVENGKVDASDFNDYKKSIKKRKKSRREDGEGILL